MKSNNSKITLKFLHQLARELYFELDDFQCKNLLLEFDAIEKQMAIIKKINTDNVKPLDFPFEIKQNYLRSDITGETLTTEKILFVASQIQDNYIVIDKVINNEK